MSKLIQMRSRIQTIETIKKVTHAMRLISMSSHSRLNAQQDPIDDYINALSSLFAKIQHATPLWSHERLTPSIETPNNPLIIIVGSQKGLCGSFNTHIQKTFSEYLASNKITHYHTAALGKKAIDFMITHDPDKLIYSYQPLTMRTFLEAAQQMTNHIITSPHMYSSVTIISNVFKSFFVQKPMITALIPLDPHSITKNATPPTEGYLWDENPHDILNALALQYIEAQVQYLLFQSLLAEHAARFISMDTSTRNANSLLDRTKLEYNKLRQAKITTEITELSGSF